MTVGSEIRIHIVGGPGSGKSTMAPAIARNVGGRSWDLDDVALSEGAHADWRPRRSLDARVADVERLAAGSTWVSEGSFLSWTSSLFERATVIIWLDTPWRVASRRIVSRHVRSYVRDVRETQGLGRVRAVRHIHLRALVGFLQWASHYYNSDNAHGAETVADDMHALTRAATAAYLSAYQRKVVRLTAPDLGQALAAIADRRDSAAGSTTPTSARTVGARIR